MGFYNSRPQSITPSSFRSKAFLIPCIVVLVLLALIYSPLPDAYDNHRDAVVGELAGLAKSPFTAEWHPPSLDKVESNFAFATFLAGQPDDADDGAAGINDHYFQATRILAYQLLHAPETRSRDRSIPFLVLVTDRVPETKRERLRRDGAIVVPAVDVTSDWVKTEISTWQDVMTKLRLWELTQFDLIAFVDGDTVLNEPLDGVFQDPAVAPTKTRTLQDQIRDDEGLMPLEYTFAAVPETTRDHHYPPLNGQGDFPNINYLNAGFFVFKPSLDLLNYYFSVMAAEARFDPLLPEQNLLNYAHRREGNMPWKQLGNTWNMHYPTEADLRGGVKSLHEKWWEPVNKELRPYLESWRWRMEGFYEAIDLQLPSSARLTGSTAQQ